MVRLVLGFESDWLREWHEFLDQSQSVVKQNQCNSGSLSTQLKIAHFNKNYFAFSYFRILLKVLQQFFKKKIFLNLRNLFFCIKNYVS